MKFPCRKFVGASVIVLIALGSVAPVRLTHAHGLEAKADECATHNHGHSHDHSHEHVHPHHHHDDGNSSAISAFGLHTHVYLLGVDIVVPGAPSGDDGQSDEPADETAQSSLGAFVRYEPAIQASPSPTSVGDTASIECPRTTAIADGNLRRATARFSAPLCDTARRERTGVLIL